MRRPLHRVSCCLLTIGLLLASSGAAQAADEGHGAAWWRSLKQQDFRLPPQAAVMPLALEAATLLGSTDQTMRDEIAYEAFVAWVYRDERLTPGELNQLRVVLAESAVSRLGSRAGDSLFLRSFSVLVLSVLAAEDLKTPFLDATAFNDLVDLGVRSLSEERDLRGYVPHKGWGHATAHCADLLKFLARSPHLTREQQARIVEAIARRLQSAGQVFVWGEDGRLAYALASLAHRVDADPGPFNVWFGEIRQAHVRVWAGPLDPAEYVRERAQLNALSELAADLEADTTPGGAQDIRTALRALRSETR
jgi:hypothetical protein